METRLYFHIESSNLSFGKSLLFVDSPIDIFIEKPLGTGEEPSLNGKNFLNITKK